MDNVFLNVDPLSVCVLRFMLLSVEKMDVPMEMPAKPIAKDKLFYMKEHVHVHLFVNGMKNVRHVMDV